MCRVSLFNKQGMELLENKLGGLKNFLDTLETSCGGHGNGISLLKNGKIIYLNKGIKYSNDEIVKKLQNTNYDWCVYHTRVASIGTISASNAHPFRYNGTILAMNGTESGYKVLAEKLNITDTEAVLLTTKKFNLPLLPTLASLSSVFMGFDKGQPYVAVGGEGYFKDIEIVKEGEAVIFASEFPYEVEAMKPEKFPFVWTPEIDLDSIPMAKAIHYRKYNYISSQHTPSRGIIKMSKKSKYFQDNFEAMGDGFWWNFADREIAEQDPDNEDFVVLSDYNYAY